MSRASRERFGGARDVVSTPATSAKPDATSLPAPPSDVASLVAAMRDIATVMAAETLRQMPHCSRCDRPARCTSSMTGGLLCAGHRDERAALGHGETFTDHGGSAIAERLYALVTGLK